VKAVRLKSSGQSVGRRMIYGGKDLWNRCVLSLGVLVDGEHWVSLHVALPVFKLMAQTNT